MADPYIDPATGIFRNKLGITDAAKLAKAEFEISRFKARELHTKPIEGDFDREHLEKVHQHLFGDVYDWAGKERLYGVEKGEPVLGFKADAKTLRSVEYPSPNVPFGLGEQLAYTFQQLKADNHLKGLEDDPERFASTFAKHMTEIWECHEFREGNTRTTTAFCRQLADEAGYALAKEFPPDPSVFRDSLALAAASGDYERLQAQIDAGLDLAQGQRRAPEPPLQEIIDAAFRLELETERRLETLTEHHVTDLRALEQARDEAKEAYETHVEVMISSPPRRRPEREQAELTGRELDRQRIDTDVAVLNSRDDFQHDRQNRESEVRREVAKDLPNDAALVKQGQERRSFDQAIDRWRTALKGHEAAPENRAAASELVDSINRLQGVAANRARLSAVQIARMERQRETIERGRDRGQDRGRGGLER